MNFIRKIKLKSLKAFLSFLALWDITTDICYLTSRPVVNSYLWKLSLCTIVLNLLGPGLILIFGYFFNIFIHVFIFKTEVFNLNEFINEIINLCSLSHSFVFKSILDQDIPKKKAIYRTAFLIHITIESFPQLVIQSVTNQSFHLWFEPFGLISFATSLLMIIFTFIITIKTDKYYL